MKPKKIRRASEALRLGRWMVVLPPVRHHPMPTLGWRLFQRVEYKQNKFKWVCVMMGHRDVMDSIVEKAISSAEKQFKKLQPSSQLLLQDRTHS